MKLEPIADSVRQYGPAASHSESVAPGASISGALETYSQRLKVLYVRLQSCQEGRSRKGFPSLRSVAFHKPLINRKKMDSPKTIRERDALIGQK